MNDGGNSLGGEKFGGRRERLGDGVSLDEMGVEVADWFRHNTRAVDG